MSVDLFDVNVLIALCWPNHAHHESAHVWLEQRRDKTWATCPITQLGFVRVSSNPGFNKYVVSPRQALASLRSMIASPQHVFWPDIYSVSDEHFPDDLLLGHNQTTDAYLLGLAIAQKGRLVTFDRRISSLLPQDSAFHASLCVIS